MKKFVAGGCSFTFGNELSDDVGGRRTSKKSWSHLYWQGHDVKTDYHCVAWPGSGNSGIARRVFDAVTTHDVDSVVVMWTFTSRYDWAMPRHQTLEETRWATISPRDTDLGDEERHKALSGSEVQRQQWAIREAEAEQTGVKPFANSLYKHAANQYHELYLSWKSIVWLQNLLEKKSIPYAFTLADNTLFYQDQTHHKHTDRLLSHLHDEINLSNWFFFGERCMGFNQWALLNDYERGSTHPLDKAHADAIMLIKPEFDKIIGGQR